MGQAPTLTLFFLRNVVVFLCGFFVVVHISKKNRIGVGWVFFLANPSFSRIFGFFLT